MSKQKQENLSSLMDGEHETDIGTTVQTIKNDRELKKTWQRYHLISDSLQGRLPGHIDCQMAERISGLLANEPVVLAPQKPFANTFLKPVAGFAIAASVAGMAIIGIQQHRNNSPEQSSTQIANINAPSTHVRQYNYPSTTVSLESSRPQGNITNQYSDSRLNSYLVNYNEFRTKSGMQTMLPYVRVVVHGKNEK